jgi:hypothetical protein
MIDLFVSFDFFLLSGNVFVYNMNKVLLDAKFKSEKWKFPFWFVFKMANSAFSFWLPSDQMTSSSTEVVFFKK